MCSMTSSNGLSETSPAIGRPSSAFTPCHRPRRRVRLAISLIAELRKTMSASFVPTTTTLCASWATLEASAPFFSLNPRTKPTPILPVARCRSTTTSFKISRAVSETTSPCTTFGVAMSCLVTI